MTKITYTFGKRIELTVSGHAGAADANGTDLCCAAASMLAFTLMQTIKDMPLRDKKICYADGYAHIGFKNTVGSLGAAAVVRAILTGFRLLKEEYPDNVGIERCDS